MEHLSIGDGIAIVGISVSVLIGLIKILAPKKQNEQQHEDPDFIRISTLNGRYVSREVFDLSVKQINEKLEEIREYIKKK